MAKKSQVGIVLSGGGARGAYEVGLLAGMVEVLGLNPMTHHPFKFIPGHRLERSM